VVARSFSKIYGMAGMRLGYAVGAKERINRINDHLIQDNGNAAVLSAALPSLSDADRVASPRAQVNATRTWLCAKLADDSLPFIPSQANFVMIDMGADRSPSSINFAHAMSTWASLRGHSEFFARDQRCAARDGNVSRCSS
jgi:histidinol-phosphate aminotransferase